MTVGEDIFFRDVPQTPATFLCFPLFTYPEGSSSKALNGSDFISLRSPAEIAEILLPEKCVLEVASALRIEINRALAVLRDIASGRDVEKFLTSYLHILVCAEKCLLLIMRYCFYGGHLSGNCWLVVLSIVGSWCNFLSLFSIASVVLHFVPASYEKYEDQVDSFSEKAWIEIKKQYAVFDAKVLSNIPKGLLKEKKED
ncbi:hypothetical protein GH714_028549 [Hevea brasiliensis]|uniref:Reticulon-like protein n=1 Tax=Hevea brasiliensis TaxID=3981 RepID=A0A6A6MEV3_HEVBR|nr:hypothetical protein GH714_028549 [Hevea brasiliensis]